MIPPSGAQHELESGTHRAVVVEVGGGLRAYEAGGRPVLDGYARDAVCDGGRGQALLPWPNRVGDGRYTWDGTERQLALSEPAAGNAIHGLTRWSSWSRDRGPGFVMRNRLYPQQGWDWILDLSLTYGLDATGGLTVTVAAVNASETACPWGAGFHPYLAAFGGVVDDVQLTVPAAAWYTSDARGLPTGQQKVDGTELDFRRGRRVGAQALDTCLTDLERDGTGRAVVDMLAADGRTRTRLWMDAAFTHVMVFSGDTLSDPARRRRGLAVEPMTGPPDMLRSGEGRLVLEPGGRFEASWGITPDSE
ncbi:MAG: aldose 1-epimerase family protein [Acidimicrobiaceae bacterium]|nr:aldose 1-epimerase family protein [Acidimicrobiaceae bacterium]